MTVAVNLAFEAAATGRQVLLVDADTYGGAVATPPSMNPVGRPRLEGRQGTAGSSRIEYNHLMTLGELSHEPVTPAVLSAPEYHPWEPGDLGGKF